MATENNKLIVQSNALTESRYDFTKIEKNCIYKIIEKVRHDYVENPNADMVEEFDNMKVTFTSAVLGDITDSNHTRDAHDALVGLRKRDIDMVNSDGSWANVGLINWSKFNAKTKTYTVEVSSMIMPHLVELARQYTSYSITVAMALKSVYSQRFYELCCQYRNNIEVDGYAGFHKTQEQLRKMFCLEDKYLQNQDFNRNIIKKAQKEIKAFFDAGQCDLWFDVTIKGRGKAQSYDFKIYTREQSERQKVVIADIRQKWFYINGRMKASFKRDPKFVERTMKALEMNPNLIEPVFNKVLKMEANFKDQDLSKMLRWILREDFNLS